MAALGSGRKGTSWIDAHLADRPPKKNREKEAKSTNKAVGYVLALPEQKAHRTLLIFT
jgi:hypothetical protein